ncbi:uncharacterized protein ACRADG_001275 isoform 2-T2 [Cochliomyia hominivorax]
MISFKYGIDLVNEDVYSPCEMDNVYFTTEYVDPSNLTFEFIDDGTVHVTGNSVLIKDIGQAMNPVSLQIYKKDRDQWVNTIYNMKRNDVCTALFNPQELWHEYIRNIPKELRKCPMQKGLSLPFNVTSNVKYFDFPDPRLAGEYKAQIIIDIVGINETLCVNIFLNAYRL